MKKVNAIAILLACIALAYLFWNKYDDNRVTFTCVGGFSTEVQHDRMLLKNVSDITISFFNNNKIFMAVDGSVTQDGKRYHMSRELWFRYETVDLAKGIVRANLIEIKRTGADNIEGDWVNHYILGAEREGRIFRIWHLNNNVLLIGNAFSPVLSCSILQ